MPPDEFAVREAERFLRDRSVTSLPIDPFAIADDLCIEVQAKPTSAKGVSGMLIRSGEMFGIMYATHINSQGFQRFSVGHELGHYLLPGHVDAVLNDKGIHQSHAGFISDNRYEREADQFAAGLLMPGFLFADACKTVAEGLDGIQTLADRCLTSLTATAIRYTYFTGIPAAVVQSVGDRIQWCFMSDALREVPNVDWIRANQPIPRRTKTWSFNQVHGNVASGRRADGTTDLSTWFGGRHHVEMTEEVIGLGSYGRTLTVLTAEDFDLDELDEEEELEESWTPRFRR